MCAWWPGDHLGCNHAFFFCLVGEQLAPDCIADREDIRKIRAHFGVDRNLTTLAEVEAERCGIDTGERRLSSD